MKPRRIYADPQKTDDQGRLLLTCQGTQQDLQTFGITLQDNLFLHFWRDDADDAGNSDPLYFDGVIHYNQELDQWVAEINWATLHNASEETAISEGMQAVLR